MTNTFLTAAAADPAATSIQPGTYRLRSEMSAASALALLLEPSSRQSLQVQIIEGNLASHGTPMRRLIESGAVRPIVDHTVPMRDAAEAHRIVESSGHLGKVLLATG